MQSLDSFPNSILRAAVVLAIGGLASIPCYAADNECQAQVKFGSKASEGSGTKFVFEVATKCGRSTGRFDYSFVDIESGKTIERTAPSWKGTDGKAFKWSDEYSIPVSKVKDVKVNASTIKSTKID